MKDIVIGQKVIRNKRMGEVIKISEPIQIEGSNMINPATYRKLTLRFESGRTSIVKDYQVATLSDMKSIERILEHDVSKYESKLRESRSKLQDTKILIGLMGGSDKDV